jgi:hypothetical protein
VSELQRSLPCGLMPSHLVRGSTQDVEPCMPIAHPPLAEPA